MNNDKNKTSQAELFISTISSIYMPALNPHVTTHWFTTDDIFRAVKDVNPAVELSKDDVFAAMKDAGYQYGLKPGSNALIFYWMLRLIK